MTTHNTNKLRLISEIFVFIFIILLFQTNDLLTQNLYRQPKSITFDAIGKRYFISNNLTGEIVQLDAKDNRSYFKIGLGSCRGLAICGDTLYCVTQTGLVGINLKTETTVMTIEIPGALFLSPQKKEKDHGNVFDRGGVSGGCDPGNSVSGLDDGPEALIFHQQL